MSLLGRGTFSPAPPTPYIAPPHDSLHDRSDRLLDRPFRVVWRADVCLDHLADYLSHDRRGRSDVADGAFGESGKIARVAAGGEYCGQHFAAFFDDSAGVRGGDVADAAGAVGGDGS